MSVFSASAISRRSAALVLLIAVLLGGGAFLLRAPDGGLDSSVSGLPDSYQSVQVSDLQGRLPSAGQQPAIVVFSHTGDATLSTTDRAAITAAGTRLSTLAVGGTAIPPQYAPSGKVAFVVVPLDTSGSDDATIKQVKAVRAQLASGLPDGLKAQVTGAPAFTTDISAAFDGADVTLLLVTVIVVGLLLLITYRSPILWIIPLLIVAATEQVALHLVDVVLPKLSLTPDGATTGITSVLVFGAATDYALLLIARYREELRLHEDRFEAMRSALKRTAEAILASGLTVVLAVSTLLLATLSGNRSLGVACAIGVGLAMLSALFVLPAVLVLFGRWIFWPLTPKLGSEDHSGRVWGGLGARVQRHPWPVLAAGVVVLLAAGSGVFGVKVGLSQNDQFRVKPESVLAAQTLASAFPAGASEPVAVITNAAAAQSVVTAAKTVDGVASATVAEGGTSAITEVDVVLTPAAGTAASDTAIRSLRSTIGAVPNSGVQAGSDSVATAVVGGTVASNLDTKSAYARDQRVILPLILVLILFVLIGLLRALVAPVLLVLTVVVSYAASVGASWLLLDRVLGYPALDSGVLLLSFLFLAALGVDYNIFLITRAREEARRSGTRAGMLTALRVTGGVITSAGVLLAAVFAVLGVLPVITLTQIGIIVGIGVLLDTLLVRTVLVPALAFGLGRHFWWPGDPDAAVSAGRDDVEEPRKHSPTLI